MTYDEISASLRLFFGARELFRKLGFSSSDLFLLLKAQGAGGRELQVICVLRAQGKSFSVDCGPAEKGKEEMMGEYRWVAAAINDRKLSPMDLERIWTASGVPERAAEFVYSVVAAGFTIPCGVWRLS